MASHARSETLSSVAWAATFLGVAFLFSACPPPRPPAPSTGEIEQPPAPPTSARHRPQPTASTRLEERPVGEASELTPAPEVTPAETPSPTPTTTPEVGATLAEPESLLTHIGPGTPPNVAAALRLIEDARQQMQQGAYDAALDRLERAVAIDPTNAYGYYFLARVHFLKKNYDQAIAFASRAASLSARADRLSLGRIRSLQGAVFEEVGRYPDARKAYQQALEADPDNLSAQVGLTRLSAGE
jgi:Flp pilus assembly protein TadD